MAFSFSDLRLRLLTNLTQPCYHVFLDADLNKHRIKGILREITATILNRLDFEPLKQLLSSGGQVFTVFNLSRYDHFLKTCQKVKERGYCI